MVHYMQVNSRSGALTSKAGHFQCNVNTAFASLDVGGNDLDGRFPLEHNRGCGYFDIDDGAGETDKPLLGGRDRSIRVAYFRDSLPYLGVRFGMDELEDGLPE